MVFSPIQIPIHINEILVIYIVCILLFSVGGATRRKTKTINFREKEKEILDQIIGSDRYDSRIRPAGLINDTSKSRN